MSTKPQFANKPFLQLVIIAGLCIASTILFTIIGTVVALVIYQFDLHSMSDFSSPTANTISALKLMQLFSAIGLFIVPPIVYSLIVSKGIFNGLALNTLSKPINYFIIFVLMFAATPFLSWTVEFNAQLILPDFLDGLEQWMKNSEDQAMQVTKLFLSFDGIGSLFYVLLIVAVVPAVGEELLFRGVLQKIMVDWTKNAHLGIWITAILFSALHMQFYGFLPRMLLGIVFGYLFFWSKSLWLPILGHFINNGSVVIMSYFYPETINDTEFTFFAENSSKLLFTIASLLLALLILIAFKKINAQNKNNRHSVLDTESL
jgi:CAAX protease family protein